MILTRFLYNSIRPKFDVCVSSPWLQRGWLVPPSSDWHSIFNRRHGGRCAQLGLHDRKRRGLRLIREVSCVQMWVKRLTSLCQRSLQRVQTKNGMNQRERERALLCLLLQPRGRLRTAGLLPVALPTPAQQRSAPLAHWTPFSPALTSPITAACPCPHMQSRCT